jgi:hypothetical protein
MDTKPALDEVCADASGCNYNMVNECVSGTHDCSAYATCLDTFGRSLYFSSFRYHILFLIPCKKVTTTRIRSFTCSCQPGFIGSGTVCSDMNECLQGSTMCGLEAFCRNTFGSYDCVCQMGFYLNLGACVSCPTGTSTDSVGALSSVACTMCDAGENNRPAS